LGGFRLLATETLGVRIVKEIAMADALTFDPGSFKGMEQAGWQRNAAAYDDLWVQ
jgi:hypothetical protein